MCFIWVKEKGVEFNGGCHCGQRRQTKANRSSIAGSEEAY